jgi:oligosaccharide repeat unit polymerase
MLSATVALLVLLTLTSWSVGRSILFPPVLYCAIWSLTLGGLLLCGPRFLPISEYACLIYFVGAASFVAGGVIFLGCCGRGAEENAIRQTPPAARAVLDATLFVLIVLYPYFLHLAVELAGTSNPIAMLAYIRTISVENEAASPFGPLANLTVLAPLVAFAMAYESDGSFSRRMRAVLALVAALAYSALTGTKGGALLLVVVFFVTQIRTRRIRVKSAVVAVALVVGFFSAGLLAINMGGQTQKDTGLVAREIGADLLNYWLSSPVAFSKIAEKPDSLPSSESIGRFFLQTGNSLGMRNSIPSINSEYTAVEADGENSNTYTIYFSYFKDYGWIGTVLLLAGLGAFLSWSWRWAMTGGPVAVILYANFCTAVLQSIYSENFFLTINFYLKAIAFYLAVYRILPALFAAFSLRRPREVTPGHGLA